MLGHAPPPLTRKSLDIRGGHPAMDRSFTSGVLTPRRSAPYNSIVFSRADKSNRAANFEDSGSSSLVNVHLSKFSICVIAQVAIEMQLAMQRPFNATTHEMLRTRGTDDHQEIAAKGCYDYVHSRAFRSSDGAQTHIPKEVIADHKATTMTAAKR